MKNVRRTAAMPSTPYCTPYRLAGSGGSKQDSNAVTFSKGAKLKGAIEIHLASRTGYRTNARIDYKFVTPGRLCGTHGKPNGTPRRLVMRKP